MGTLFKMTLMADSHLSAKSSFQQAMALLNRYESQWSPWKENSEIWQINQNSVSSLVLSDKTFQLVEKSLAISELTHGAFDITFASVGHLYDYRKKVKPSSDDRHQQLKSINYQFIKLYPESTKIELLRAGVTIDLGGIAKGQAIDDIKALLLKNGISSAYFSLGGDSYVLGKKGEYSWMLGIKHPRDEEKIIARIPLEDVAVSTSGDYERFYMDEGKRIHHILSPETGLPAEEVMSITVIGSEAWKTDALSTSIFVMGVAKGLKLIESVPNYDAIVIDRDGKIVASSGLSGH